MSSAYSTKKRKVLGRKPKKETGEYKVRSISKLRGLRGWDFSHEDNRKMYFKKKEKKVIS